MQFKSKDMDDCRAKMQWLVDHPDDVRRFREHAVERVRTQYSWDNVVSEYERLFESLLAD